MSTTAGPPELCGKCGLVLGAKYYSSVPAYGSVCVPCHDELYAPLPEKTLIIDGVVSVPESAAPPDPSTDRFAALEARVAELERRQDMLTGADTESPDRHEVLRGLAPLVTLEEYNKHSAPIGPGPCSPLGCRCVLGPDSPIQPQCDERGQGPNPAIKAE